MISYALAEDFLQQGLTVVADSVNPLTVTRRAWREVARLAGTRSVDVEVVCSDVVEHERRATTRGCDIAGLVLPTWAEILGREYEPWDQDRLVVDTARLDVAGAVAMVRAALSDGPGAGVSMVVRG